MSSERGGRRRSGGKAILLGIIALAAALALISATQPWLSISFAPGAAAASTLEVSGQQLNPPLSPVAIAVLAAVLALTIARSVFRRVLGLLVALLGAGIVSLGVLALANPRGQSESSVGAVTGILGESQHELIVGVAVSAWPAITVAAGAVAALAGVAVLIVAGRWARGGRRYEASAAGDAASGPAAGGPGAAGENGADDERDRISDWDAITHGEDPTGRA